MSRQTKLKKLLTKFSSFDTEVGDTFASLDREMASVTNKLKESVTAKTIEQVSGEFKKIQKSLEPLFSMIKSLETRIGEREKELTGQLKTHEKELNNLLSKSRKLDGIDEIRKTQDLQSSYSAGRIEFINGEIKILSKTLDSERESTRKSLDNFHERLARVLTFLEGVVGKNEITDIRKNLKGELEKIQENIDTVWASIPRGGGNANRQILINGTNYLTKYNDINLIGSITAADNDTLKRVDITFSGSGGGFTELETIDIVNSSNVDFRFTEEPDYIVADGVWFKQTGNNGTVFWTWNSGDSLVTMVNPPSYSIWGVKTT